MKTSSIFTLTFKRREEYNSMNIPKKIVLIYFGRFAYEFILLNSEDSFMIKKGGKGRVFFCPPFWDLKYGRPDHQEIDLSSPNPRNDDVEQFKFTFDENAK